LRPSSSRRRGYLAGETGLADSRLADDEYRASCAVAGGGEF
jgi:hypothetical protein